MITLCSYVKVPKEFASAFYLEDYVSYLRIQGLTSDTVEFYIQLIERFIRFSGFKVYNDFDNFVKLKFAYYSLTNRPIRNNTISKYYKSIKKYTEFLRENELVEKLYITQIQRVKVGSSIPKALTEEDVWKIRNYIMHMNERNPYLKMRNYMLVETLLYIGIRRIEAVGLKRGNICDNHIIIEQGKGQKDRIVYIPKLFSKQLKDWLSIQKAEIEYVFSDRSGEPMSRNAISCVFRRLEKAVGFKVHAHTFYVIHTLLYAGKGV